MRVLFSLVCVAAIGFAVFLYLFADGSETTAGREPTATASRSAAPRDPPIPERAGERSSGNPERSGRTDPPEDEPAREREELRLPYARATLPAPEEQSGEAAPREPLETVRFDLPVARAAGRLEAGDTTIRLAGLDALGPDETCKTSTGKQWPCGHAAMHALRRLIRGRSVICDIMERPAADTAAARCTVANIDINEWLVRRGWARPAEGNAAYDTVLEAARRNKNGQWRDAPPWEERE